MRRKKLIWQLFPPFLLITFISLLATTVYVTKFWRQIYLEQLSANLLKLTLLAESQLKPLLVGKEFSQLNEVINFLGQQTDIRFSVMLPDGVMVGDSAYDPEKMENHGDRPEIQAALKGEVGVSTRRSYTLDERMIYLALPVKDHNQIIGLIGPALPVTYVDKIFREIYLKIISGSLVIVLLAAAFISLYYSPLKPASGRNQPRRRTVCPG